MSKKVRIFIFTIFAFFALTFFSSVDANTINSISMDVFIDDNGNASVTEVWKCNATQGTEVYHPYYNLGKSKITDLSVSENGTNYDTLSSWKTSNSFSDKAYKCGINNISNGIELCWGISEYGSHNYIVKYNISNFVSQLTDSQMVYWTLIPHNFSNPIGNASIKIHTNFNIPDSVGVWGYGNYGGTAYVHNGCIEMQSSGVLYSNEYMTILVQFPSDTFNCSNKLNHDFNYYLNMAEKGTEHYSKTISNFFNVIAMFLITAIPNALVVIILLCVIFSTAKTNSLDFGKPGKRLPKHVDYFRDIPCNNDLHRAYFIAYNYGILNKKTDILGAILLKWIKDSIVKVEQRENSKIFKKENTVIVLKATKTTSIEDPKERLLFNMLYSASKDGFLENNEFKSWCKNNYSTILDWFDDLLNLEKRKLISSGLLVPNETRFLKIFKYKTYLITPDLRNEALELLGLKKYLLDYTLIKDREAIEVTLFEDYLIYAQMLGIANTVAKQFKELYPDIIEQSCFTSYDNFDYINVWSTSSISSANTARIRAETYSSGGGGFSSGGGGGGSFGGGGGGGGGFR